MAVRMLAQSAVESCPDTVMDPAHYRDDATCRHRLPIWVWDARIWPEPAALQFFAPGLRGICGVVDGVRYIPVVMASKPGSGALTRYLAGLTGPTVFTDVISGTLASVLERHGFHHEPRVGWVPPHESPDGRGEWFDGWVRP